MSVLKTISDETPKWFERVSDWANPILVKEARQSLKSRQFVITFLLLLAASWLLSVFLMLISKDSLEYGAMGGTFFMSYYIVLSVAIFLIVPFGAYRSLLTERDQNTFDMLSITTLTPRQIVWGKLWSALLQTFIYYSAIAPFIAFASLLQGFDFTVATFMLAVSVLLSLGVSMLSLMLSTLGRQRQWQTLMSLIVLAVLVIFLSYMIGMAVALPTFGGMTVDADFWWALAFSVIGGCSYFVLCRQITTAQLTFASANHSTGIRATCTAQFLLLWGSVFAYTLFTGVGWSHDEVFMLAVVSIVHFTVFGLFFATESDFLSRRIRRDLPRSGLVRLLITAYMPGGSRGLMYLLAHLSAVWLLAFALAPGGGSWPHNLPTGLATTMGYVAVYLGIGTALARWGESSTTMFRASHARVITLLLVAAGCIGPWVIVAIAQFIDGMQSMFPTHRYSLIHISNPFVSLEAVFDAEPHAGEIQAIVAITASVVLLVNIRGMLRGVEQIVGAKVQTRRPSDVALPALSESPVEAS